MAAQVLVPIADGIEEIEAVTIIDTLRRASVEVTVASVGQQTVTASRGTRLMADKLLNQCREQNWDMIVLPGGMPGAEHLRDHPVLIEMLQRQRNENRMYAAICASPAVVLETHGLLNGLKATCYPSMQDQLENAVDERVVVDLPCVTSQGPGTAMEFAIKLVEILTDEDTAEQVASGMLFEG